MTAAPPPDTFTEIEVMLAAWRAGTPASRDVALQLADDNRRRALTAREQK